MNLAGQAKTQLRTIPINNAHWQYHGGFVTQLAKRDNAVRLAASTESQCHIITEDPLTGNQPSHSKNRRLTTPGLPLSIPSLKQVTLGFGVWTCQAQVDLVG